MTFPLIFLGILSVIAGFVVIPGVAEAIGLPGGFGALVYTTGERPEEFHFSTTLALAGTLTGVGGILFGSYLIAGRGRMQRFTAAIPDLYNLAKNKFYFDEMYQWLIDRVILVVAYGVAWFDRNIINDTGVDGSASLTSYLGFRLKFAQTGRIPNYALAIVVGIIALVAVAFSTRT
jgi:NADH-quinone oxidoreductase subunit L